MQTQTYTLANVIRNGVLAEDRRTLDRLTKRYVERSSELREIEGQIRQLSNRLLDEGNPLDFFHINLEV